MTSVSKNNLLLKIGIDTRYGRLLRAKDLHLRSYNKEYRSAINKSLGFMLGGLFTFVFTAVFLFNIHWALLIVSAVIMFWMLAISETYNNKATWMRDSIPDWLVGFEERVQ